MMNVFIFHLHVAGVNLLPRLRQRECPDLRCRKYRTTPIRAAVTLITVRRHEFLMAMPAKIALLKAQRPPTGPPGKRAPHPKARLFHVLRELPRSTLPRMPFAVRAGLLTDEIPSTQGPGSPSTDSALWRGTVRRSEATDQNSARLIVSAQKSPHGDFRKRRFQLRKNRARPVNQPTP
jgi:hypothetical protein